MPLMIDTQPTLGHPAVDAALAALAAAEPQAAERAAHALEYLLAGVAASAWPEVAWSFSRLTWDGFPVEFTCSSADRAIRYTVEVAGPEVDNHARLDRALELIGGLGCSGADDRICAKLRAIQAGGALRYGAWVGGRHERTADRYKIYAEVPAHSLAAGMLVADLLGGAPLLSNRRPLLRMLGYEPGSSRVELYFRADDLEACEVPLLLRRAKLHARAPELLELLAEAYGRTGSLPGRMGFSYSVGAGGEPAVFSLFCFARALLGNDARVMRRVLALAEQHGWALDDYARLSAPFGQSAGAAGHGMAAFVVAPGAPLMLHVGVRPPDRV